MNNTLLRFQNHRKTSHHTVRARTTKKDIIKRMRGECKTPEYRRHVLSDFCSSGIGIEIFAWISSFAGWSKVPTGAVSCFLILSSFCTNRGRSCVCFHGRRSRKTEMNKMTDGRCSKDTWRCARTKITKKWSQTMIHGKTSRFLIE